MSNVLHSASAFSSKILPLRQRAEVRNRWLKHRLGNVRSKLMAQESFDMWLVIARECNEDPVIMTPCLSQRRLQGAELSFSSTSAASSPPWIEASPAASCSAAPHPTRTGLENGLGYSGPQDQQASRLYSVRCGFLPGY